MFIAMLMVQTLLEPYGRQIDIPLPWSLSHFEAMGYYKYFATNVARIIGMIVAPLFWQE